MGSYGLEAEINRPHSSPGGTGLGSYGLEAEGKMGKRKERGETSLFFFY